VDGGIATGQHRSCSQTRPLNANRPSDERRTGEVADDVGCTCIIPKILRVSSACAAGIEDVAMTPQLSALPPGLASLAAWPQFVCWFASPIKEKIGKFNKFPCRWDSGAIIDAQDPKNWTNAASAIAAWPKWDKGHGGGIGFVFTKDDPYFFIDIDGAWHDDIQAWSPIAHELCRVFSGCYVEVSRSGKGLHIVGSYQGEIPPHSNRNIPLGLEFYTSGRFVALTGIHPQGYAGFRCRDL
jgi:primase-polymerase (primpol)-like protein